MSQNDKKISDIIYNYVLYARNDRDLSIMEMTEEEDEYERYENLTRAKEYLLVKKKFIKIKDDAKKFLSILFYNVISELSNNIDSDDLLGILEKKMDNNKLNIIK